MPEAVILVEGVSDQLAVSALARRLGRDFDAERISVLSMGGSKNIGAYLDRFGPRGLDVKVAGLCDAGEEGDFRRALEREGLGKDLSRPDLERLGFFVCVKDLEDELIRSLGVAAVEQVVFALGDLDAFRSFQQQPAWRNRSPEQQLRRFLGTKGGRKIQSAPVLVDALDLQHVPAPLDRLLAYV